MSNFSDYLEQTLLDVVFNGGSYMAPMSWDIALYTAMSNDGATATEVSGGSYARKNYSDGWTSPAVVGDTHEVSNTGAIVFPGATASWGTVTHMAIFENGGSMLFWGLLDTARTVNSGETFQFAIGDLRVALK